MVLSNKGQEDLNKEAWLADAIVRQGTEAPAEACKIFGQGVVVRLELCSRSPEQAIAKPRDRSKAK